MTDRSSTVGGYCPTHMMPYPCHACLPGVYPMPYQPPAPPAYVPPTTVTSRTVPVPCAVCDRKGYRPELGVPDDPDAEWLQCDACDGKGWLMVTETITTR